MKSFELERHADGSVFVVDPDPLLCDPVNGNSAVVAKCCSPEEARGLIARLRAQEQEGLTDVYL